MSLFHRIGRGLEVIGTGVRRTLQLRFGSDANSVVPGNLLPGPYPIDTTGATEGAGLTFDPDAGKYVPGEGGPGVPPLELAITAPATVTRATAAVGGATTAAKADHKHDVSTAAPGTCTPGASAAEGSATSLARSDHAHALAPFGTGAGQFCEGNDARILAALTNPLPAALDANGQRVEHLPLPGADTDAARARDVPAIVVRAMTITGMSGYTATATVIEANSVGAVPIDGLTPAVDDLVAVNVNSDLSAHVDNGIYRVTVVGDGSHKLKLTRDPRFTAAGSIYAGLVVVLTAGNSLAGLAGVPVVVTTAGAITPGTTAFAWNLTVATSTLFVPLNANSKTITAAQLVSSQVGTSSTRTTYDGATKVLSQDKSANFSAVPTVPRYWLTADGLTITIDESAWTQNDDTVEFWADSPTETTSPKHTFGCSAGGVFKFAGSGGAGSGVSTFTWPTGAESVVITRRASGVYTRA